MLPNNPSLTINDLDDVKQIDGLFRAHVLLAELAGRSSPDYKDYLLQAHAYLIRLWQVRLVTVRLVKRGLRLSFFIYSLEFIYKITLTYIDYLYENSPSLTLKIASYWSAWTIKNTFKYNNINS